MISKFFNSLYIFLILFFFIPANLILMAAPAKADTLVIQNDGEVVLVLDDNILGVFIADNKPTPPPAKQEKPQSNPSTPVKAVPIVPPNTPSIVQTSPGNSNKLQVTIRNQTPPASANQTPTKTSVSSPTPVSSTPPTTTINKDVNKVIFEGATNQPVMTIKSNENVKNSQIIQQGSTQTSTSLPLQIDTKTRSVSAVLPTGTSKINVLPEQAIQGVLNQGLINDPTLSQSILKVTLEDNQNQAVYKINGERSGTLFGIFPVKSPVEVKLSAQTGTVVSIVQSLPFRLFSSFIK